MKVKMKTNLILLYQQCKEFDYRDKCRISTSLNEMQAVKERRGMEAYFELKKFLKSIEGKVIELEFTNGDAFEKNDNNVWLPESLWEHNIGNII